MRHLVDYALIYEYSVTATIITWDKLPYTFIDSSKTVFDSANKAIKSNNWNLINIESDSFWYANESL